METCSICLQPIVAGEPFVVRDDAGALISTAITAKPVAVFNTASGQLLLCERCYLGGFPVPLPPVLLHEMHAQFATDYNYRGRYQEAIQACKRALEHGETADTLALLACAHAALGHHAKAKTFYRRALAIEPNHFMATNNLNVLLKRGGE